MDGISRRALIGGVGVGAGMLALPAGAAPGGRLRATHLRAASMVDPLGIGDPRPMLAWRVEGPAGTIQAAWQVRVASDAATLAAGGADLWDSGWVAGAIATGIRYDGAALASRRRCHWQVRLWDAAGRVSGWSDPASWEMGLLADDDWTGEWLAVESAAERDDRLAEPRWSVGETTARDDPVRFRLAFRSTGGDGLLTIHTDSRLLALALEGVPLAIPDWNRNAYGGPPAARFPLSLTAGEHLLTAAVEARPAADGGRGAIAAQLRLPSPDGNWRRIVEGWEAIARDDRWAPAAVEERADPFPWPTSPARLLRRAFRLAAAPRAARLYVAALGGYRIWINGVRVGNDELQSEPSEYRRHIPYRTHDVGPLLRAGANVVGVMVGDGFYASYQAPDGRYAYGPAPRRFRLMIEARDAGGERIATDGDWRHHASPVTLSEIYAGEDQDRRLWPAGWAAPGFDDAAWEPPWPAPVPAATLAAPLAPPIRATRTMRPVAVRRIGATSHIVDFGQNFAGRIRLTIAGARGLAVSVRHAEILTSDGRLDRRNLRVARAQDRYVLAGDGVETLEPFFTFQGFRYAQVDGPIDLRPAMVVGVAIGSDLAEIGTFSTSQPLVQKLWVNTLWSQRSNFRGNPTDCPQRDERLGWTGDAQVFWDNAAFNMDVAGFTRSFTRMLRDDQAANGAYPMWSPSPKGLGWGTTTPTPGWADAGVMLPYVACLHAGDRAVVDDNWSAMTAYGEGILAANPDGLWREDRGADLGDWLALDAKQPGDETTPKPLIATAMLARSLDQLAAMAGWTGRAAEAARWRERAARTREAFAAAFVAADGAVGNGSHTGYVLALRLGLVPTDRRAAAAERLAADIRRRGTLLATGFLGTPLALDALADAGHVSLAFDLLLRTGYPSWGYMIRHGATTTWERWNSDVGDPQMNSFNHYAFGAVCSFLYRRLGAIEPIEPGFRRFRVAPLFDPRFATGGAAVDSASGRIEVTWRHGAGRATLDLVVPPNTLAEIVLPGVAASRRSGRHRFSVRTPVSPVR